MTIKRLPATRRAVLGGAAATGLVALGGLRKAWAQSYPTRNINVVIPTAQGGGVERHARAFAEVWRRSLGVEFEYEFHAGAAGQVGYEIYAQRKEPDGHNLLYGNMGAEIVMYATQDTSFRIPEDITYVAATAGDVATLFVGADSPFQTIEDLVEEGMRRTITVGTSRLPHPASIGALILAEDTGASFNLVPFAGGNATSMAAITREVDCGVLPAGVPIGLGDQVRILCVLGDAARTQHLMPGIPSATQAFGTEMPHLTASVAWAIHTRVWEDMPEVRETLERTIPPVFDDPALEQAYATSGLPYDTVEYSDHEWCLQYVRDMIALTDRYRDLISGG